ncbi:MAG: hypothetical protein RIA64_01490 [Rhodospirillales bacterium]
MLYELWQNGSPVKTHDFPEGGAPVLNPKKGAWYPVQDDRSPVFDPDTHKLGPVSKELSGGKVIWTRSTVALGASEKLQRVINARAVGYAGGTLDLKGVSGRRDVVLGFWMDAVVAQIEALASAQSLTLTDEMQALIAVRDRVKENNPKPD